MAQSGAVRARPKPIIQISTMRRQGGTMLLRAYEAADEHQELLQRGRLQLLGCGAVLTLQLARFSFVTDSFGPCDSLNIARECASVFRVL